MEEPERLLGSGATSFERKLLEAVKDERPSAELRQRMEQALGLPQTPTLAPQPPSASPVPPPARAALGGGVQAVAFKVLVGLVVAGGLSYSVASLTIGEGDPSPSDPSTPPRGTPVEPQQRAPATRAPEVTSPEASEAKPSSTRGQAAADELPEDHREPATADSLRVEIELLDAVRAASSRGQSKLAEDALERYDARFPRGVLHREADMLRRAGVKPRPVPSRGADPEAASGR